MDMRYYYSYFHGRGRFILIKLYSQNVHIEVEVITVMKAPLGMLATIGAGDLHLR